MPSLIYLSGPQNKINDPKIPFATDWKTYASSIFLKSGINIANPIELDISGFINNIDESGDSVKYSLSLIDKSDCVLANIFQQTEATTMEIFYAHNQGKKVIVVGNEPYSPWVMFHSEARFQNLKDALDHLVNKSNQEDRTIWANNFETQLVKKSEQYPPLGEADYEYYGGNIPVLIMAPHASSYFRDGILYPQESYTGSTSVLLHKLTGCHSLISSYCMVADPLLHKNLPFINFASSIIKKGNIKLVIILRGIDWSSPNDIVLNTWNNESMINKTEYLNLLQSILRIKDLKEIGFNAQDMVKHSFLEGLSVPILEIGINKRFRSPNLHPKQYTDLYTALSQFLMLVGMG